MTLIVLTENGNGFTMISVSLFLQFGFYIMVNSVECNYFMYSMILVYLLYKLHMSVCFVLTSDDEFLYGIFFFPFSFFFSFFFKIQYHI